MSGAITQRIFVCPSPPRLVLSMLPWLRCSLPCRVRDGSEGFLLYSRCHCIRRLCASPCPHICRIWDWFCLIQKSSYVSWRAACRPGQWLIGRCLFVEAAWYTAGGFSVAVQFKTRFHYHVLLPNCHWSLPRFPRFSSLLSMLYFSQIRSMFQCV